MKIKLGLPMLRLLSTVFVLIFLVSSQASASDENGHVSKDKLDLAEKYYDLNPTWKRVSSSIRNMARDLPPKQRLVFVTAMEKSIDKQQLKKDALPVIAELFSQEELEAMIKFYNDPDIQSALAKQETFERRITPKVTKMIDAALLEFRTQRNDAPTPEYP